MNDGRATNAAISIRN